MSRKLFIFSIVLTAGSGVLFLLSRFAGLPTLMLFLGKAGLLLGGVGAFAIPVLLWSLGKDHTEALLKNFFLLVTTLVVLLIICEFGLRFIFRDITTTGDNNSYFARRWYERNVRLNSWGFREGEFTLSKRNGIYRIAVVGDSFTFGQGIAEHERFSNLLENYLNNHENSRKTRYQVLNFGKSGTETIDHLAILRDVVLKTQPDFVLLQWFVNDFEGRNTKDRPRYLPLLPSATLSDILGRSSALYYLVNDRWRSLQMSFGVSGSYIEYMSHRFGDPESPDSVEAMGTLRDFIRQCKGQKEKLGIVLFPQFGSDLGAVYPFAYLHNRVIELCHQEGIECLDLRTPFAQYPEGKKLFTNQFDAHPGPLANQIAAKHLIEKFGQIWLDGAVGS